MSRSQKEKTKSAAWNADRPVVHYTRLRNLMVRRVIFADSASMLTENMAINFGKNKEELHEDYFTQL